MNNMLYDRRHLLRESLFAYLFYLPDTDDIMTLLRYLVCCTPHSFQL